MLHRCCALALVIIVVPPRQSMAQDAQANLRRRIQTEYPKALEKLERYYSQLRGSADETTERVFNQQIVDKDHPLPEIKGGIGGNPLPMTVTARNHYDFAINGQMERLEIKRLFFTRPINEKNGILKHVEITDPKRRPKDVLLVVGESGAFGSVDEPETGNPNLVSVESRRGQIAEMIDKEIKKPLYSPFRIDRARIADILADPTFLIKEVREVIEDGTPCLRVWYSVKLKNSKLLPIHEGWFLVSPTEGWILRKYELAIPQYARYRDCEITYRPNPETGAFALPTRVRFRDPWSIATFDFEKLDHEIVPVQEFSMTSIGLPDITKPIAEHVPGRSAAWYFWAAGGAILVALGLRFAASRNARRSGQAA